MNWLIGVVCLMSVGAARYGDYSGVKMPQYNIEYDNSEGVPISDDYKDHSPDAAPSLDYRYEDELQDRIDTTETVRESWRKRSSRKKAPKLSDVRVDLNPNDNLMPKYRSNRRLQKHRPKSKQRIAGESKRFSNYERQYDDIDVNNYFPKKQKDDIEVESDFDFKYTTQKIIRRKARDRTLSQERLESIESDEDLEKKIEEENIERRVDGPRRGSIAKVRAPMPDMRKYNLKKYTEDDEYFDIKRVNNLKHKLPELLRRTTVENTSTEASSEIQREDIVTSYRRANISPKSEGTMKTIQTTASTTEDTRNRISNMSLAEKSRLSILKAQKKDSVRNSSWTTKPPVLMQVTQKMQTMVVVEPNDKVQLRAREVFEDSVDRVAKAKKLMRHKLVSGARSIQDLTDNWDEMICDYIDVTLLDNETITTTKTSVAEREIKAFLSQRHSVTTGFPITFPPDAVDPGLEDEWNRFISESSAPQLKYSVIAIIVLPIINCLKNYRKILLFLN